MSFTNVANIVKMLTTKITEIHLNDTSTQMFFFIVNNKKTFEMSFTNVIHVVKNGDFNDIPKYINDIEQLCHKPDSLLVT